MSCNEYVKRLNAIGPMNVALGRELLGRGMRKAGAAALEREISSLKLQLFRLETLLGDVKHDIELEDDATLGEADE